MDEIPSIAKYADKIGGVFHFEDIELIPYNHWKKDMEWLVMIVLGNDLGAFIPVRAYTAREAALKAIANYQRGEFDEYE